MTAAAARILSESEKRNVVIGVLVAMFLATLDQTIVAPALPTIGASFGDVDFLPWIVSAYLLTSTAVTPLYGKLSDIHGRRPVLICGLLIFLAGSVMCALAPSMMLLIVGRAVQGLGGGGLITLAQTVIADIASPRERAKYVVYISTVWATSSVAGPVLGGFLAQHFSWTLIFWINLPLCALAIFVCDRILRDLPQQRRPHRLDILGSALMIGASVGLMLALTLGGLRYPWTSTPILALGAATLALAAWLAVHLAHAPEPLIPLNIFANDVVGKASGALFFSMFAFVGATVYLPIYFEYQLGSTPTEAGAGLIVLLGGSVIGANTAGRYMPHVVHYKRMAYAGLFLAIASLTAMAALAPYLNFAAAQVLVLGLGLGLGPLFPTTTVSVQNAVDPRDLGIATATLSFLRTFGSALGVAAFGAIIFAFGLVAVEGGGPPAVGVSPDLEALAGCAFRAAFAAMALAATIALGFFALMEERPLRGPAKTPVAPEA
jgi:EmrB/QacA subfamily drug resistance transporter